MDMRLVPSQQMRQSMRQIMAPRMIQSMEILQMPLMALQERIDQELSENPVLEEEPATGVAEAVELPDEALEPPVEARQDEPDNVDGLLEAWLDTTFEGNRPSRNSGEEASDRKQDAMLNMPEAGQSLSRALADQLGYVECDPVVHELANYIIFNLDEAGYLRMPLEEVTRDFGGEATQAQAMEALAIVQRLDPPGVGARHLGECLLLQITPEMPLADVLRTLVTRHLADLEHNRLPAIEKATGYPIATIKEAIEHLRRLDPRPGARFRPSDNRYVLPDVLVELDEHGAYQVRLVTEYTPQLSISRYYQDLVRDRHTDAEARDFIQKRIQSARWLIESIEQRRNTLLKVARAIVARQREFLDKGPESIQPLKMQQIADEVGVHVTTVSRAVDDKWVQTPRGLFPLKRFFGGGTTTSDGEEVAWDTIKQKLLELIAREDKQNPMSDEDIMKRMSQDGIPVARRTVTKYRKALRIPSSRQRKEF